MKTAKIGAIFIVAVMSLTAIGAAYAHWEDELQIEGVMTTDDMNVYFTCYDSNDPPGHYDVQPPYEWIPSYDPNCEGYWSGGSWGGCAGIPDRRDKDIGSCDVYLTKNDHELNIVIDDAYPCYWTHPYWCIKNSGSVPALLQNGFELVRLSLQNVSDPNDPGTEIWLDPPMVLEKCTYYFFNITVDPAGGFTYWISEYSSYAACPNPEDYDFSLHRTGDDFEKGKQLDPQDWTTDDALKKMETPGDFDNLIEQDLAIHFENGCLEKFKYDFKIKMVWWNWPHAPED